MFKYLCKNKKGISLAELLVAITIVGFVFSIASQLLVNFTNTYKLASRRWEIQSAVHLACNKFEKSRDSIVNAHKADLIYDTAIDKGVIYNTETHTITWNQVSKVIPAEGTADSDNVYTYIFSAPAKDQNGKELGSFLFIRDFDAANSTLFLNNEGMGEVPVDISFRVATSPDLLDSNTKKPVDEQQYRYLTSTVEIDFKPGLEGIANYEVVTQFTIYNFNGRSMTMQGSSPVYEQKWLGNAYPAGWSKGDDVIGKPNPVAQYVAETNPVKYGTVDCSEYISEDANVMRFISERAVDSKGDVTDLTAGMDMASCLTKFLFIDGTKDGARTVGALRDFRDNVLKGTAVGDYIIDRYYNSWSPALIEVCKEHPTAGKAIKAVLEPIAKVLGTVSCE